MLLGLTPLTSDLQLPTTAYDCMNRLYCGDNLRVLREEIPSESIDLVYLDPPFNSQEDKSVIYHEADGRKSAAQVQVFEDTWHWNEMSALAYYQTVTGGGQVGDALQAFQTLLDEGDMLAYLSMMAARLVELHRVLKPTGSLYLHCDPAASHYLKVLLDTIFGAQNFRNEIVWLRSKNPKGSQHGLKRYSPFTDSLLYYVKTKTAPLYLDRIRPTLTAKAFAKKYQYEDEYGPYADGPILRSASMGPRPNLVYEYKGFTPGPAGWRVKRKVLEEIDRKGNLNWTGTGVRRKLRPSDIEKGQPIGSFWGDIPPINSQAQERLGYPTQKPKALLARIISASSNENDVVLDPFCGCGTTIDAAQRLKRQWIGIDITHLAVSVIRSRLQNEYPGQDLGIRMGWMPTTEDDARKLFDEDAFQFQCWVLGECGINPLYQKRGADRGVDGRLFFFENDSNTPAQIIFSVKGGKLSPVNVRELAGVVKREKAQIGVLVTLEEPTQAMIKEAASALPWRARDGNLYRGIQMLTAKQILDGYRVEHPAGRSLSFPDAKMAKTAFAAAMGEQQKFKFG